MKIWDYIDLDKAENEIKENTEPEIPLITAAPATAPAALAVTPVTPAAAPVIPVATPTAPATALTAPVTTPMFIKTATPTLLNQ